MKWLDIRRCRFWNNLQGRSFIFQGVWHYSIESASCQCKKLPKTNGWFTRNQRLGRQLISFLFSDFQDMFCSRAPVICCGDLKPSLSVRNGRFDDPQISIVVWQSDEFLVPDVSEVVGNWDISVIPHRIHGWYICIYWPTKTAKCR